ncbi:MAG: PD40 domain-containing protein, partial [Sinomicrobium sp.]|nr:PD40 domain-containing protein [Sinomicrobium sp.]
MNHVHSIILLIILSSLNLAAQKHLPSFEEVISLHRPGSPVISPDGKMTAFTVTRTDWKENNYDTEIWLSKNGMKPFQLTNKAEGGSADPQWSPDGQWIAFLRKSGEHVQIHVISP